jgi:hypothetical protein
VKMLFDVSVEELGVGLQDEVDCVFAWQREQNAAHSLYEGPMEFEHYHNPLLRE